MPLDHVNNNYHVDTFLEMQKDLAIWLKEGHLINGEWSIAEKKRFLNKGCIAVAAATRTTTKTLNFEAKGVASTNEIQELAIPAQLIEPVKLFIDGLEYKEKTFDEFMDDIGGFMQPPPGSPVGATGQYTTAAALSRFFYWDQSKNVLQVHPKITETKSVQLYAVVMPNLLSEDNDVSILNPIFTNLAAAWAAWKMLPQDEEHKDRGREAQRDYISGIRDFESHKRKRRGNIAKKIIKDQDQFGNRSTIGELGRADLGVTWDRL